MRERKKTMLADILGSVTKYFLVLVAVVIIFIAFSGVRVVKSGEVALILRFGKLVGDSYEEQVHEPGLRRLPRHATSDAVGLSSNSPSDRNSCSLPRNIISAPLGVTGRSISFFPPANQYRILARNEH